MLRYRFGAVTVDADLTLPGYARYRTAGCAGRCAVTVRRAGRTPPVATPLCDVRTRRGTLRVGVTAEGHRVVTVDGLAACTVGPRSTVDWHVGDTPNAADTDHLLSLIVPWTLGTAPDTAVLHAATVVGPRGAVLLCGTSGAGKSTLATALHRRLGRRLFGDDAAVLSIVDGTAVVSSCSREVRLWADSGELLGLPAGTPLPRYGNKHRHAVDGAAEDPVPVRAVLRLVDPAAYPTGPQWRAVVERVRAYGRPIVPLTRPEGIVTLRNGLMRLAPLGAEEAAREFGFLVRWGTEVPVMALRYSHSPAALELAIEAVAGL